MPGGRPRLKAGTFGDIGLKEVAPEKWVARVYYRDNMGKRREATRTGHTKNKAKNNLKSYIANDLNLNLEAGSEQRGLTIRELGENFIKAKEAARRAPRTLDSYRHAVTKIIAPGIGDLTVTQATPKRLQGFIGKVAKVNGPGNAKTCRSVLSGMMGMAVANDLISHNPIQSLARISQKAGHRGATALNAKELERIRQVLRTDKELRRLGIGELFEFMSYVGCRIGEALALRDKFVFDDGKRITLGPSVARAKGNGLKIYEPGKTASTTDPGWRTIVIPDRAAEIVSAHLGHPSGLIFPSIDGNLRDTSNTESDWRANRDRLGFPGFTSHGFRKTIATLLDGAGLSARDIADYLGHRNPSMTQDVYMAKNTGSARAAGALNSRLTPHN